MIFEKITWATWWIGTILVVSSWVNVVPNTLGWIGFGISCASSLTSIIARKYWKMPSKTDDNEENEPIP